jgi:hypothetical protein
VATAQKKSIPKAVRGQTKTLILKKKIFAFVLKAEENNRTPPVGRKLGNVLSQHSIRLHSDSEPDPTDSCRHEGNSITR